MATKRWKRKTMALPMSSLSLATTKDQTRLASCIEEAECMSQDTSGYTFPMPRHTPSMRMLNIENCGQRTEDRFHSIPYSPFICVTSYVL